MPTYRDTAALLDELFEFLRIPSISSGDGADADLERAAAWVADRIRDAGGTAAVEQTDRNPLVVGRIACGREGAPQVLLYGHYDVQTVAPLDAWRSDPFEPVVRDGAIYARGSSDDKGNFHCLLATACDLARSGGLTVDLTIVSDGEEEVGGDTVVKWLDAQPQRFDAAVVFDSSQVEQGLPAVTTGTRGIVQSLIEVRTADRDGHSGIYGGTALNAAHVLADLIASVAPRDGRLAEVFWEGVIPPSAAELESWAALPAGAGELAAAGLRPLDPEAAAAFYVRTCAQPSFDVNAITCRDAAQQRTIIPAEAQAMVSMRIAPGQHDARIFELFERHLRERLPEGAELAVTLRSSSDGAWFDPEHPVLRLARGAFAEAAGGPCAVVRSGGTIPLLAALCRHGVPAVLSGAALATDDIHAPNEHLRVESYELGVRMARNVLVALGALQPS